MPCCSKLGGVVPAAAAEPMPLVAALNTEVGRLCDEYLELLEDLKIRAAIAKVLDVSGAGNKFLQVRALYSGVRCVLWLAVCVLSRDCQRARYVSGTGSGVPVGLRFVCMTCYLCFMLSHDWYALMRLPRCSVRLGRWQQVPAGARFVFCLAIWICISPRDCQGARYVSPHCH